MSQIDAKIKILLAITFSTAFSACAPQVPVENGKTSNASNGTSGLQPAAGTPIGGTPGSLPTPTPTPTPGASPTPAPSTASCAASTTVTWMVQDTSYRADFAGSPEKRSYLCAGSLPRTTVGSSAMASSTNGNAGVLMYSCQLVNGTPTWQHSATYNPTTGEPVNVSCGIYTSSYRPADPTKLDYRFHESRTAGAQNQMYGLSMIVRSYHPTFVDHLFSLDKTEGPNAGYILEGVGFSTVHLAATQDLGRSLDSVAPTGLTKVYRCYSAARGKHYITTSPTCDVGTDTFEGSGGYLFSNPSTPASGAVRIPIYRCRTSVHDFATPALSECQSVGGSTVILGYSMQ
jgi:hypothetical protein